MVKNPKFGSVASPTGSGQVGSGVKPGPTGRVRVDPQCSGHTSPVFFNWNENLEEQVRSDNYASEGGILEHFGTFWDNSEDFLTSLDHLDGFPSPS